MSLQIRRIIVWVLALLIGAGAAAGIIFGLFQTSIEKYMTTNAALLAIAVAALVWIWLDYFFSTDMLPK